MQSAYFQKANRSPHFASACEPAPSTPGPPSPALSRGRAPWGHGPTEISSEVLRFLRDDPPLHLLSDTGASSSTSSSCSVDNEPGSTCTVPSGSSSSSSIAFSSTLGSSRRPQGTGPRDAAECSGHGPGRSPAAGATGLGEAAAAASSGAGPAAPCGARKRPREGARAAPSPAPCRAIGDPQRFTLAVPAAPAIAGLQGALLQWYGVHQRDVPWRATTDPYGVWVSEMMLIQTQVKTVVRHFRRWMDAYPTLQSVAAEPDLHRLHDAWGPLGLYRRVELVKKGAGYVMQRCGGRLPSNVHQLKQVCLPLPPRTPQEGGGYPLDRPPPPPDQSDHRGTKLRNAKCEICHWGNLMGPFLVHKLLGPKSPLHLPRPPRDPLRRLGTFGPGTCATTKAIEHPGLDNRAPPQGSIGLAVHRSRRRWGTACAMTALAPVCVATGPATSRLYDLLLARLSISPRVEWGVHRVRGPSVSDDTSFSRLLPLNRVPG